MPRARCLSACCPLVVERQQSTQQFFRARRCALSIKQVIPAVGRVRRFQTRAGNVLEDAVRLAARLEATFAGGPRLTLADLACQWASAALRNNTETVDNAVKVAGKVSDKEFLRLLAPVYGWTEAKIDAILAERAKEGEGVEGGAKRDRNPSPRPQRHTTPLP